MTAAPLTVSDFERALGVISFGHETCLSFCLFKKPSPNKSCHTFFLSWFTSTSCKVESDFLRGNLE